ncbi:soma ferritin-like [Paramacrobiotus metropolitanus]|uniref:soma ferritin-like n=1 Tax=Paramacrobiotus metropolitanus TaxID=2943436 RepID=UPI0024456254|nr:soma ferritin-like [Paramacrobiotus metropolitanus]
MGAPGNLSLCRQNYHVECEAAVNRQINMELTASYFYSSLSAYFDRDDVALRGFVKYFKDCSDAEREDASKLIHYQTLRGGRLVLGDIKRAERDEWGVGLDAMQASLEMQRRINASLLELQEIAGRHKDPHMTDFLEEEFLRAQAERMKKMADHITNLKRVGPGLGEYQFDHVALQES